jgi:hypothetical protein
LGNTLVIREPYADRYASVRWKMQWFFGMLPVPSQKGYSNDLRLKGLFRNFFKPSLVLRPGRGAESDVSFKERHASLQERQRRSLI